MGSRGGSKRPPRRARLVGAVAGVALILPTVDQVTLQPYQTTYVNLATDLLSWDRPDDQRPGGDYWRVSIPELVARSSLDRQLLCKATTIKETDLAYPFTNGGEAFSTSRSTDCREEANGPLAPDRLDVVRRLPASEYDAVFIGPLPRNCTPLDEVSRWRHGFDVVMTTLGRCTVDPALLPAAGVRADDPALGTTLPGDLWLYAVDGWLQWPGRTQLTVPVPVAELAFQPDPSCLADGCTLVIAGEGPDDLVASVDGLATPVTRTESSLRLPISAAQAGGSVWVTLSRSSGEPSALSMHGLSLAPASTKGKT